MKKEYSKSVAVIVIFIIAMILMFKVSAILGGIVYLIAFGISFMELKSRADFEGASSIVAFIKNIKKETLLTEGVFVVIVAIIPIIAVIAVYRWIVVDTVREVDALMDSIY